MKWSKIQSAHIHYQETLSAYSKWCVATTNFHDMLSFVAIKCKYILKFQVSTLLVSIKFPFKRPKILSLFLNFFFPPFFQTKQNLRIIYLFLKAQKFIVYLWSPRELLRENSN